MTTIPRTLNGRIIFFEQHLPSWSADPGAIGLSAQQVADITLLTEAARADFDAAHAARQLARSATILQHGSIGAMMRLGTALVATIRAYGDATDDEAEVAARANIPPIDAPSPAPPPTMATGLSHSLRNSGAIRLKWRGTVANGTFYSIWRTIAGDRELLGSVSARGFTDKTIPAGTPEASYQLRTHRDEHASAWSEMICVKLGVAGSGDAGARMGARSPDTTAPRRAAA